MMVKQYFWSRRPNRINGISIHHSPYSQQGRRKGALCRSAKEHQKRRGGNMECFWNKTIPNITYLLPVFWSDRAVKKKMPWTLQDGGTGQAMRVTIGPVSCSCAQWKGTMYKPPDEIIDHSITGWNPNWLPHQSWRRRHRRNRRYNSRGWSMRGGGRRGRGQQGSPVLCEIALLGFIGY